jgi:hypothetical protein
MFEMKNSQKRVYAHSPVAVTKAGAFMLERGMRLLMAA